ncbi:hypothetical protein JXL83_07325 [candidate division WOR-3 bacterium]|nr:hypothetical protein [candidate division WOR-3 bacterium]
MKIFSAIILCLLPTLLISGQLPARMSVVSGEVIILKSYSDNPEYGIVNLPVESGDSIYVKSGYLEIDIEDGSTIRIGENSSCLIIHTGQSEDDNSLSTRVYANFGEFEMFSSSDESSKSYLDLETDVGIITSFPSGVIRANVNSAGEIEAEVIKGSGAYKTKREEKLLEAGDCVTINSTGIGSIVTKPVPQNSSITSLPYKSSTYETASSPSRAYVPKNIENSSQTLDENGTWIYVSSHGYCWKPKPAHVNWKPYYDGEWVWTSAWGWTWVSYEPWGWWTYHYGYWVYSNSWGWIWVPGARWYPARVVWWWGPGWIAWYPYPYYYWYPWYYDHWWICVSHESFYRPRYRYHDPLYGFVGDKPTRTYDPVDFPDISSGSMVRSPEGPDISSRNPSLDDRLTSVNPNTPVREIPEISSRQLEPVRENIENRSPANPNDRSPTLNTRSGNDLTARNNGSLTSSRPVNERTPTVNSDMRPPRQGDITTRTPPQENNSRVTATQPTTRTNPPTNSNTRPETNSDTRNNNPPTNNNTRPETNNTRNNNPPTNNNQSNESNDDQRNYTPPTNNNTRPETNNDTRNNNPPTNNNQRNESNDNQRNYTPPTNNNTRPETNNDTRNNNPPQNQRPPQNDREENNRRQSTDRNSDRNR